MLYRIQCPEGSNRNFTGQLHEMLPFDFLDGVAYYECEFLPPRIRQILVVMLGEPIITESERREGPVDLATAIAQAKPVEEPEHQFPFIDCGEGTQDDIIIQINEKARIEREAKEREIQELLESVSYIEIGNDEPEKPKRKRGPDKKPRKRATKKKATKRKSAKKSNSDK